MPSTAPQRIRLPDFSGRPVTLPENPESWEMVYTPAPGDGNDILLLGTGPGNPLDLPFCRKALATGARIHWLEGPKTRDALCVTEQTAGILQPASAAQALQLATQCLTFFYRPGLRLEPAFWGEILAKIQMHALGLAHLSGDRKSVAWLPGDCSQLLHLEMRQALLNSGFQTVYEDSNAGNLIPAWRDRTPELLVSINFRGLDSEGRIFHLCRTMGVKIAIWLVDNPWHLLSGIRLPWWRDAQLFVTDKSFIGDLKACGAKKVDFLPLAASWHMWNAAAPQIAHADGAPVFIGRSAFPGRQKYFAGVRIAATLESEARNILLNSPGPGELPDYHWWQRKIGAQPWPSNAHRATGLGADTSSTLNRWRWVRAALAGGLKIIGDRGWEKWLPGTKIMPPVDYYSALPAVYASASAILNVTSLLLPASLNQRHFDVWAAGGLLLGDRTSGLNIFPPRLTEPVTLNRPEDFVPRLMYFNSHQQERHDLIHAWRDCLRGAHTYEHRLEHILALTH